MRKAKVNDCCVPKGSKIPIFLLEKGEEYQLALFAKAVGHPIRVQILKLLIKRNACVCGEIVNELPLAQSTVSQHLKVLKDSGLVQGRIDGPRICYCIDPAVLKHFKRLVANL